MVLSRTVIFRPLKVVVTGVHEESATDTQVYDVVSLADGEGKFDACFRKDELLEGFLGISSENSIICKEHLLHVDCAQLCLWFK